MPRELTGAEEVAYNQYLAMGTPDAIQRQIRKLKSENADRRQANADLEQKLKDAGVPEGSVVLPKGDAEKYEAYKALGEPKDLTAKIEKADELQSEIAKRDREAAVRKAAQAAGYKESVLTDLSSSKGLTLEVREEKGENDETRTVAYVKDADGKDSPLKEYVEKNLADYVPALTADTDRGQGSTGGTNFLAQQSSRTAGNGSYDPKEEGRKMAEAKSRDNSLAFK